jgi:putative ABC transport system permease protein
VTRGWWRALVERLALRGVPPLRRPELLADLEDDLASRQALTGRLRQIRRRTWWLREIWSLGAAYRRQARATDAGGWARTSPSAGEARALRGLPLFDASMQDVRFTFRMLLKRPGFALVAILTLAVGVGATTAVFSVVDGILFRSLPYAHEDRLVSFGLTAPFERDEFMLGAGYVDFRRNHGLFETVTSMMPGGVNCDVTEQTPVRLTCALVEESFLPTLGVVPVLGRNFTLEEDQPKAPRVALISYSLWQGRFGGNPGVLERVLSLDDAQTRIVGVLPPDFELPTLTPADILLPQALNEALQRSSPPGAVLRTFARMKPGIGVPQATAGLQPFLDGGLQGVPSRVRKEIHLSVRLLRDREVQDARAASWILFGAVLAVLLVACTNVANLLLARATARQRELAVRTALGASRGRLARQALTESTVLGVLGGAVGAGVGAILLHLFVAIAPDGIPRLQQAALDPRVMLFTLGVSLACGAIFGIGAAMRRPALESLTGREASSTTRSLTRQVLVVGQISVSVVLLAGAGLLLRSLWNLERVPTGITADHVVTAAISLGHARYPRPEQQVAFFTELEDRLNRLPGVSALAVSDSLPPAGPMRSATYAGLEVAGHQRTEGTGGMVGWRAVTPGYFPALGIAIVQGRGFTSEDQFPGENPIILNLALARRLFPNEVPIGQQLRLTRNQGPWRTIVGIAADVKNNGLTTGAGPEFFLPWKNDPVEALQAADIVVRTSMSPAAMSAWIRSETAGLDATLPVTIDTMTARVSKLSQRPQFDAILLSLFAGTAMFLAAIGIYGVVGSLVAQQTREIGVRIALGASREGIFAMVLSRVARWAIVGAALGLLGTWFGARLLKSLLFDVRAHDPWLLGMATFGLLAVAFVAAWIPARRAMRVDPMIALRYQ